MSTRVEHSRMATGGRDDWQTPEVVLERVRRMGPIALDPCTTEDNPTGAWHWYTFHDDGLNASWVKPSVCGVTYCNMPYSQAALWLGKCVFEADAGVEIVALAAARPCTKYWFEHVWAEADAVAFWRGRITFVGADNPAPFESALVYYGTRPHEFEGAFRDVAKVVRL